MKQLIINIIILIVLFDDIIKYKNDTTIDFLDGIVFDPSNCICIVGKLTDKEPSKLDNFINNKIYWKSIQNEEKHYFKLFDYIYRWSTDMFYCSTSNKYQIL